MIYVKVKFRNGNKEYTYKTKKIEKEITTDDGRKETVEVVAITTKPDFEVKEI